MNSYYCPHLGKEGDPETAISFAHASNRCYAGKVPLAIKNDYQDQYCLVPNHQNCSVYQQNPVNLNTGIDLPPAIRATETNLPAQNVLNPPTKPANNNVEITQPINLDEEQRPENASAPDLKLERAQEISDDTAPQNIRHTPSAEQPNHPISPPSTSKAPEKKQPEPVLPLPPIQFSKKGQASQKKPASPAPTQPESTQASVQIPAQKAASPPPPASQKTSSKPKNDLYEPGSIAPPKPIDGDAKKSPPRPRKIPGLEAYGPQTYGPQRNEYGPKKSSANGQYGPASSSTTSGRRPKRKGKKRRKNRSSEGYQKRESTQPVNVRKMAPTTSPRKRLNWLTILEVLMGIVVLGGIILVVWLMISLIPGTPDSNYALPANAAATQSVTANVPDVVEPTATAAITQAPTNPPPEATPTLIPATPSATPANTTVTETEETTTTPDETTTETAAACEPPEGWLPYTVQNGDVLINLAEYSGLTLQELQEGNCMDDETLIYPGDVIYLPGAPEATPEASAEPTAAEETPEP